MTVSPPARPSRARSSLFSSSLARPTRVFFLCCSFSTSSSFLSLHFFPFSFSLFLSHSLPSVFLLFLLFMYSSHVNIPYSRVMSVARFSALSPKIEAFPLRGNRTLVNSRLVFRFSGLRLVIVAVVHATFSRVPFSAVYFSCSSVKINVLLSSFPLLLSLLPYHFAFLFFFFPLTRSFFVSFLPLISSSSFSGCSFFARARIHACLNDARQAARVP